MSDFELLRFQLFKPSNIKAACGQSTKLETLF